MIIECEECRAKFRLDEGLLREEGSRVRCSVCKRVFFAYAPGTAPDEGETDLILAEDFEDTAALESPPVLSPDDSQDVEEEMQVNFDKAFEEVVETGVLQSVPGGGVAKEKGKGRAGKPASPADRGKRGAMEIEADAEMAEEEVEAIEPEEMEVRGKKEVRRLRLFPIVLVIILLLFGGGAAVFFFVPELIPDSLSFLKPAQKEDIKDLGVRRLSFKAVSGSFVESQKAGQLFVIKGMVANDYPKSRSFILVKGALLDDKGKPVKNKLAYAGNILTESQLREFSAEEINQAMKDRQGKGKMNVNIQPQAAVPFMIVFENLPDNLGEFTVEAVSSSPGE